MKKIIALIIVCVMLFTFTSCNLFEKPTPILGVISTPDHNYINVDSLSAQGDEYITEFAVSSADDIQNTLSTLLEKEPFAIVVVGDISLKNVIEILRPVNIPVVFIGSTPDIKALDSYDKSWFLTANDNQGGEMLGFKIGNAFKDDILVDQNGDDILQCATVFSENSSALNSVIQSAEDLGVYSEITELKITDIALIPEMIKEKYSNAIAPELIICESEELAIAMQTAFVYISQPITVTFIHKKSVPLTITSPPLLNAAQYPVDDITSACKLFINNILLTDTVNNNTNIRLDSHKVSVFSYILTN